MGETIKMQYTKGVDFAFHFEDSKVVIDRCEGISPEDGLRMFPLWVMELLQEKSDAD